MIIKFDIGHQPEPPELGYRRTGETNAESKFWHKLLKTVEMRNATCLRSGRNFWVLSVLHRQLCLAILCLLFHLSHELRQNSCDISAWELAFVYS